MAANEKAQAQSHEFTAILGPGSTFEGQLVFEGIVRIDGKFRGDIFTRDTLIVGAEARVEGHVDADTVIIAGYVEGEVRASSRIEIQASGYLRGAVYAPIFKIEEGGMFDGMTQMLPSADSTT